MIERALALVLPPAHPWALPRSPRWPALSRAHLAAHPRCEACGAAAGVVAHHVVPVHIDRARELDPANLVSMCNPHGCHLYLAHCGRWDWYSPEVRDLCRWLQRLRAEAARRAAGEG